MQIFEVRNKEDQAKALGQYLPSDRIFDTKNIEGSNLKKLLLGLGGEITKIDQAFNGYWRGRDLITTTDLDYIRLWEGMVGIPDDIFRETENLSIEERRANILTKLRGLSALTKQDFIDLALIFGYGITIKTGVEFFRFPLQFPLRFCSSASQARFVMVINAPASLTSIFRFPLQFPLIFSSNKGSVLEKLFNLLKPANTELVFNYIL